MAIQIQTIVSMPFAENSYILWRQGESAAVVVDPGFEPEPILSFLEENGLSIAAILNTHGHADHIAGNGDMKEAAPGAPLIIGLNDAPLLTDAEANLSMNFGFEILSPPADRTVREGEVLDFAGMKLEVLDLPGHSVGHVVFVIREKPVIIIGGDVLFRGSVGRTDFPHGSFEQLSEGIQNKLFMLPDDAVVYPGHGPVTNIGHEKRTNPYVGMDDR